MRKIMETVYYVFQHFLGIWVIVYDVYMLVYFINAIELCVICGAHFECTLLDWFLLAWLWLVGYRTAVIYVFCWVTNIKKWIKLKKG